MRSAMEARCRAFGLDPALIEKTWGKAARDAMVVEATKHAKLPWSGCVAGRRISGERDVADLWQIITEIRNARRAYLAAIDAPDEFAATAKMGDAPPPDQEPARADPRSDEERSLAAQRHWAEMLNAMRDTGAMGYMIAVVVQDRDLAGPSLGALLRELVDAL